MYFKNFPDIEYDLKGDQNIYTLKNLSVFADFKSKFLSDYTAYNYYSINDGERPDLVSYKLYGDTKYYWTFMLLNENLQNIWRDWPKSDYVLGRYISNLYKDRYAFKIKPGQSLVGIMNPGLVITSGNNPGSRATVVDKNVNMGYFEVELTQGTFGTGQDVVREADVDIAIAEKIEVSTFIRMEKIPHHFIDSEGNIRYKFNPAYTQVTNEEYLLAENADKFNIKVFKADYVSEIERQFKRIISNGTLNV